MALQSLGEVARQHVRMLDLISWRILQANVAGVMKSMILLVAETNFRNPNSNFEFTSWT